MDEKQRPDMFIIDDLEALKVIADPLRNQILEVLINVPQTVKQVADKLGLSPSKLYYHVNLMEKHGFIEVVETRMVANMMEKYYQATANSFNVDDSLLAFQTESGKENINAMLTSIMDTTRNDILRSLEARTFQLEQGAEAKARRVIFSRLLSRIPESRADEFRERLDALLKEFGESDVADDESAQMYAMTVAFYPSIYFPDTEE